jgi:hypothetical protein
MVSFSELFTNACLTLSASGLSLVEAKREPCQVSQQHRSYMRHARVSFYRRCRQNTMPQIRVEDVSITNQCYT